ncbi:MAG: cytochrome d ubiquinol oxidase subunit II [Betaproteobacteria bacterium]|nr:cytochrome d ubiquinol oxidase subunit II [Betaproteobacteria bacterium]
MNNAFWLPVIFMVLMGVAMLLYVLLDGFDLGVGVLLQSGTDEQKDVMISSIGPFWDANETWLVLGIGLLLVAFPLAHGVILTALYLPVALMLAGLILRGVAFDFRVKAQDDHKVVWNRIFFGGSLLASGAQGYMLGMHVVGYERTWINVGFALLIALCLIAGYALLGAGWLILKTEGALQKRAVTWARKSLWLTGVGIGAVSLMTPMVSERIFEKWFSMPNLLFLSPIPLLTLVLFVVVERSLRTLPQKDDRHAWLPFAGTIGIFVLAFLGLAYSLYPNLVVNRITIWDAASAPESLMLILVGTVIVLPVILGYTIFSYRVFRGKARELTYY